MRINASDSVSNVDLVTSEDYDSDFGDAQYEVPPWLFLEQDEEDAFPLRRENNNLEIVFGCFSEESDLDTVFATPPISIEPEFDGFSIKIGEISCYLTAVKQSDKDGGSGNGASKFVDLESNALDLESNTAVNFHSYLQKKFIAMTEVEQNSNSNTAVTPIASHLDTMSLYVDDINHEANNSQLYDSCNQIGEASTISVCSDLDLKWSFLTDSKIFLQYSVVPFRSPFSSFSRNRTFPLFAPIDLSVHISKFSQSILFNMEGESEPRPLLIASSLHTGNFEANVVCNGFKEQKSDATLDLLFFVYFFSTASLESPWTMREEDELLLGNLFSGFVFNNRRDTPTCTAMETAPPWMMKMEDELLFADQWKPFSSSEPPWELLCHGLQPHDRGEIARTVKKLLVCVCALCSLFIDWANLQPMFILQTCFGLPRALGQYSFFRCDLG